MSVVDFRNVVDFRKFFGYLIIGGASALVDWVFFYLLAILMEMHFILSATITFILATLANYFLGIKFIFDSGVRFNKKEELVLIFIVSLVSLGINLASLYALSVWVGLGLMISKVIASLSALVWNYFMRNNFIFKKALF